MISSSTHKRALSFWLALFFLLVWFYAGMARGQLISTDEVLCYEGTRSLWLHGVPSMEITEGTHTSLGRHGLTYSAVNSGQSILCLPLFALGRALEAALFRAGCGDWFEALTGPPLARNGLIWGGELELVASSLFNTFVGAGFVCVFFYFSLRLGASPRASLFMAGGLALSSLPVGYFSSLYTQPIEALGVLTTFCLLYCDRLNPRWQTRAWAGAVLALTLQCRYPALIAVPPLAAYHLLVVAGRSRGRSAIRQILPFLGFVLLGFALHFGDQLWKFGSLESQAAYSAPNFNSPWGLALAGFFLSPGYSVFLYTPLLLLSPFALWSFRRTHPRETLGIAMITFTYLAVMGKFEFWHGLWCFGPRYTMAFTALLLLPLSLWLSKARPWVRALSVLLLLFGMLVAAAHITVNSWWVVIGESWLGQEPMYAFLFQPEQSMVWAQVKAMFSWDGRVDFWMIRVFRAGGWSKLGPILAIWVSGLAVGALLVRRSWKAAKSDLAAVKFSSPGKLLLLSAFTAALFTAGVYMGENSLRGADSNASLMEAGVRAAQFDATRGLVYFDIVLQREPHHYGARFQRAQSLQRLGRSDEARALWMVVYEQARGYGDSATMELVETRLAQLAR